MDIETLMPEPNDNQSYTIALWAPSLKFYLNAVEFYRTVLQSDIEAIDADPDLKAILGEGEGRQFEVHLELERVDRTREWIEDKLAKERNHHLVQMAHGFVRFLKSVGGLYLNHLQSRRNRLATKVNISKYTLKDVDQQLANCREMITTGVFRDATAMPLLVDELVPLDGDAPVDKSELLASPQQPRPVLIESIEILDADLKSRCLDLFNSFEIAGQRDRLDTVVSEATRIFEDKLRRLCGEPEGVSGVELATYAFGGSKPRLTTSSVQAEQEATHLLFRGVFGLIRNVSHHRLLGELQPERVIQVLGLLDYCLGVAQGARSSEVGDTEPAAG